MKGQFDIHTHMNPINAKALLEQKAQSKAATQASLSWPKEPKRPMVCIPTGMTDALGGKVLTEMLPGLLSLQIELLILGKGSAQYGEFFTKLAKEQSHRISIVQNDSASFEKMIEAADVSLFFSKTGNDAELKACLSAGAVPVALPHSALENYDPAQESGNAFLYEAENPWSCFAALVRAIETLKLPYDFRTIQRHGMEGK